MLFPWNKIQYNLFNVCSRAVSDRLPVFQAATSSGKVRVAVRCVPLVSTVKIKVKLNRQIIGPRKHFAGRILNAFWILSVCQEWHFHFSARKDFIVRGVQQINTPVQQGLTEICQGWLKNGSAHSVTLGCTVKRQVQFIRFFPPLLRIKKENETILGWNLFEGRAYPSGPCAAGYVCVGGASEPSPLDSPGGFLCPSGFFCSAGTSVPKPCPKGTFRYTFTVIFLCSFSLFHYIIHNFIPYTVHMF